MSNNDFSITPEMKLWLSEAQKVFEFLTDQTAFHSRANIFAAQGIYPLYIGSGANRRLSGVRLGSAVAAESKSVCFQAMVHMNEAAGLAGIQAVLDWWQKLNPQQRRVIDGDIYLVFAGERESARSFFATVLYSESISMEDYDKFRKTTDGKTNRNRIKKPRPDSPLSEINLWDDFKSLQQDVYGRADIIIGLHTFSQKAPVTVIPYYDPLPAAGTAGAENAIAQVEARISQLCAMMGGELILIENGMTPSYFEGTAKTTDDPQNLIAAGTEFRATVECGQHLEPRSALAAQRATLGALKHKWPQQMAEVLPEQQFMQIVCDPVFIYGPASAGQDSQINREWLAPPLAAGENYGTLYLITGREVAPGAAVPQVKPPAVDYLPDEIWQMIAEPQAGQQPQNPYAPPASAKSVAAAIALATPDHLGNGKIVNAGQAFAFIVVLDAEQKPARLELIYMPVSGVATMFPAKPAVTDQDSEIGEILRLRAEKSVACKTGAAAPDTWLSSSGAAPLNVDTAEKIRSSGGTRPHR